MTFDVTTDHRLADALAALTGNQISAVADRCGINGEWDPLRGQPVSKVARLRAMLQETPIERCLEFIEEALNENRNVFSTELSDLLASEAGVRPVRLHGRQSGFALVESDLTEADPAEQVSAIVRCLDAKGFTVAKVHYDNAVEAFRRGEWESSNGQLRTALESVLEQEVVRRGGTPVTGTGQMTANADKLASKKLADPVPEQIVEHLKTLIKVCHSDGSHPGIADPSEAQYRLVSVSAMVRLLTGC